MSEQYYKNVQRGMKVRTKRWAPLVADYMRVLRSMAPLPPNYIRMLQFHYAQPKKTVTATAMSKAMGFKNYRAASLHYGKLAGLVGSRMGWRPEHDGDIKLNVFASFHHTSGEWHWIMRKELAQAIEGMGWKELSRELLMPGEMPENTRFREGALYRVMVTAYERNPEARHACLAHYGTACVVCGFDFKEVYGRIAEDFIHVHHLRMLADIGKKYEVDPVEDMRPVCPNCHSVIHLKSPPYTVEELKSAVIKRRSNV